MGFFRFLSLFSLYTAVHSQTVPPLQWLDITNLLKGTNSPVPLKDAAIGYDASTSTVVIFGGEASSGIPQSLTYLLNTTTLTWSAPAPPTGLGTPPTARSGAVSGNDFAASNRHGFIIIGGKDTNYNALSDVWEFDYVNQFWSEVTISPSNGPSPRWGAVGGIDPRSPNIPNPVMEGPNNTIYYTGGFDGSSLDPLSDVWRLNVSGVLTSNNAQSVVGSWQQLTISNINSISNQNMSGTMILDSVAIYGGCNTTSASNSSCATQNTYVLNTDTLSSITPGPCPAPRFGAVMIPSLNSVSASTSQAMLLLGTFNTSLWSDGNGLENGEVDFLDISAGTWTRVMPSADPGTNPGFPSPREGSAVFAANTPIFGGTSGAYSDTLVFGGRDASGRYLNELWVLRSYNGAITSGQQWSGFGDGKLETGVSASGTGVTVQINKTCTSAISVAPGSSTGGHPGSPTSPPSGGANSSVSGLFNTSVIHKILAPLSLALLLSSVVLGRLYSPFFNHHAFTLRSVVLCALALLVCFGLGVAGLVSAFTSISSTASLNRRSSSTSLHLQTSHGRAALAFFVALYALLPLLWLLSRHVNHPSRPRPTFEGELPPSEPQTASVDTGEKLRVAHNRSRTPSRLSSRARTHSWGASILWRPSTDPRVSSDSDSSSSGGVQSPTVTSAPTEPPRSFEVVNRPPRIRQAHERTAIGPLRDIDWLQRRRSVNAVGELDYAMTQAQRSRDRELVSTPGTTDKLNATTPQIQHPQMPSKMGIILHILLQAFILGLALVCLIALWPHSRVGFIIFLVWLVAFYVSLGVLAWMGIPNISILSVMLTRLRAQPDNPDSQPSQELNQYFASQTPPLSAPDHYAFPTQGPYYHEPPFHAASTDLSHGGARSTEPDDDEDDDDEDVRQQRIESEMDRREILTVTVPRRRLWIANPT
ncbi:hypothetical protein BDP27DRAFT_1314598 [Rhodocollybia butyracea]|uniref:Uncharacterized protein n=1 Tax=Rhodocollybia butyracea TaxID=206335 RepID=A0A9P5Q771_9AGAR|nr:hypothetical protein BDP27DRAFT_1314598 [Rhodocollybia butyracea]